jgi:hypothetical protein
MRRNSLIVALMALGMTLPAAAARAGCQSFTALVTGEDSGQVFADLDKSGMPNPNDKRFAAGSLANADGDPIGKQCVVANMREGEEEEGKVEAIVIDHVFALDDGVIFAAGTQLPPPGVALHDTSKLAFNSGDVVERSILGGTGAYAGATGTLTMTRTEGDLELAFEMTRS